jgi:hypothetical protein
MIASVTAAVAATMSAESTTVAAAIAAAISTPVSTAEAAVAPAVSATISGIGGPLAEMIVEDRVLLHNGHAALIGDNFQCGFLLIGGALAIVAAAAPVATIAAAISTTITSAAATSPISSAESMTSSVSSASLGKKLDLDNIGFKVCMLRVSKPFYNKWFESVKSRYKLKGVQKLGCS